MLYIYIYIIIYPPAEVCLTCRSPRNSRLGFRPVVYRRGGKWPPHTFCRDGQALTEPVRGETSSLPGHLINLMLPGMPNAA